MKVEYPSYQSTGTAFIEDTLSKNDLKILNDFCNYCKTTAADKKVRTIRATLLQIHDIIEKPYDKLTIEEIRGFVSILNRSKFSAWTKNDIRKY